MNLSSPLTVHIIEGPDFCQLVEWFLKQSGGWLLQVYIKLVLTVPLMSKLTVTHFSISRIESPVWKTDERTNRMASKNSPLVLHF